MNSSKALLAILGSYVIFAILQSPSYSKIDPSIGAVDVAYVICSFTLILAPAAYFGLRVDPSRVKLATGTWRNLPAGIVSFLSPAILAAFVAFLLNAGLSILFAKFWIAPTSQSYVIKFTVLEKIANSASAGIWEETVFRLFLLSSTLALIRSVLGSVILSNTVFTLLHAFLQQPPYNLPALTIVFVIGLVYSMCYLRWGLESAMACHGTMNLLSMTLGASLG